MGVLACYGPAMTCTLTLVRQSWGDSATLGRLYVSGGFVAYTLEPPWRDNRPNISCIPCGIYPWALLPSPRFGRNMVELLTIPGRSEILIHPGNYPDDTQGCILPGLGLDEKLPAVWQSRKAVIKLHDALAGATSGTISIVDARGGTP